MDNEARYVFHVAMTTVITAAAMMTVSGKQTDGQIVERAAGIVNRILGLSHAKFPDVVGVDQPQSQP